MKIPSNYNYFFNIFFMEYFEIFLEICPLHCALGQGPYWHEEIKHFPSFCYYFEPFLSKFYSLGFVVVYVEEPESMWWPIRVSASPSPLVLNCVGLGWGWA